MITHFVELKLDCPVKGLSCTLLDYVKLGTKDVSERWGNGNTQLGSSCEGLAYSVMNTSGDILRC
jgi:hypothetical protein